MTNPAFPTFAANSAGTDLAEPFHRQRYGALICGVLQLCLSWMMIAVGIIKDAATLPFMGIQAFVGAFLTIFAGAFGIQYSRTAGKCPAIASMVFSIMASIVMFSGLASNATMVGLGSTQARRDILHSFGKEKLISPDDRQGMDIADLTLQWALGPVAEACFAIMVFCCLVNFIVSIVQAAFACGIVCSCCQPVNTNTYITSAGASQYPARGGQGEVNMGHMASNA